MFLDQIYSYLRNSKYELGYFINFASPHLYKKRIIFTNDRKPFLKNFLVSLSLIFVLFSVLPLKGYAAKLSLDSQFQEIGIGQQFQVNVILNTEGEELNALEGNVIFPNNLATLKEIRDGNSIISFWIERPKMINEDKIEFSGIIPGGYQGTNGFLFSAIFTAKTEGKGIIELQNTRVLKNDGIGTPANVKISNFQFNIKDVGRPYTSPEIRDAEPPETFRPEIAKDAELFNGKYFLVFATQDKGSGIAGYAIHENTRIRTRIDTKEWITAEGPYVLQDQNLRSYVYVKAVDKAGNERIIMAPPQYPLKWYENGRIGL